jgi:Tfp pilus assembly protein PilO
MMQALTPQQKDIIKAGFVLAILIFAGAFYYYSFFVRDETARKNKQIETLKADIKKLDQELRDIQAQMANPEELKAKKEFLDKIAKKLPEREDSPGFYAALVDVLRVTHIEYSELTPLPTVSRSIYAEIPYRIKCQARYHDFGHFLNLIEENPNRFMRVKTFTIENQDNRPSIHPVTIELATFMFVKKG